MTIARPRAVAPAHRVASAVPACILAVPVTAAAAGWSKRGHLHDVERSGPAAPGPTDVARPPGRRRPGDRAQRDPAPASSKYHFEQLALAPERAEMVPDFRELGVEPVLIDHRRSDTARGVAADRQGDPGAADRPRARPRRGRAPPGHAGRLRRRRPRRVPPPLASGCTSACTRRRRLDLAARARAQVMGYAPATGSSTGRRASTWPTRPPRPSTTGPTSARRSSR